MLFQPGYDSAKAWLYTAAPLFGFHPIESGGGSLYMVSGHWQIEAQVYRGCAWLRAPGHGCRDAFEPVLMQHSEARPVAAYPVGDIWEFDDPDMLKNAVAVLKAWLAEYPQFNP